MLHFVFYFLFFFFNDTATTEIYTLSLHDALPICVPRRAAVPRAGAAGRGDVELRVVGRGGARSEEHTSELQSQFHLVCRLLLEKKKKKQNTKFNLKVKTNMQTTRHVIHLRYFVLD